MEINGLNSITGTHHSSFSTGNKDEKVKIHNKDTQKSADNNSSGNSENSLNRTVDKMNKAAQIFDRKVRFQLHEGTNRTIIEIIDTQTDEVIREFPSEKLLDMFSEMEEHLGQVFNIKA